MKQAHPKGPETIEPGTFRLGYISLLAGLVGVAAGFIAYILYDLIGLFTNLAYYHAWSFHFRSPENTPFHYWIIVIPVIGGLIVGFMAKYGSEKIKGHGIPEAMEAVLTTRSRIEAKVAILKPLSAAIAIGTGGAHSARRAPSSRPAARSVRLSGSSSPPPHPSAKYCSHAERVPVWPPHSTLQSPA